MMLVQARVGFLKMLQASSEAMSKLPPYLEKYTAHSMPAHPCELVVDNAYTKTSVVHDFCFKVAEGQLPTTLFRQLHGSKTAQTAEALWSRSGNPFPRGGLVCTVDFSSLTDHMELDTKLLRLHKKLTAEYEESLVLWSTVLSLYDTMYDQLIIIHQLYKAAMAVKTMENLYHRLNDI